MWRGLEALASESPRRSNMARHAAALVYSPDSNPYRAYRRARIANALAHVRWVLVGPFAGGPHERNLPRPVEWLVDLPAMAQSLLSMPVRLVV